MVVLFKIQNIDINIKCFLQEEGNIILQDIKNNIMSDYFDSNLIFGYKILIISLLFIVLNGILIFYMNR